MDDYSQIVAKNLIALRKSRDLTQQDFAKILNYSDKTISKWELGYAIPNVETLKQIADYYEVTVDYFLVPHQEIDSKPLPIMDRKIRRILIMALFDLFFFIAGATAFAAIASTTNNEVICWPIFLWALSLCLLFNSICANQWWKHTLMPYIFVSATIWGLLVTIYFTIIFSNYSYNFWYLFFMGLPVQFAAIIILSLSHSTTN
ncbi:MAG: helix-turn-helix domain-containing protein [Bacilli bacterium]|nr:helix-turn-helix domain-containing protein [Bacilli bacterium]